MEDILKLIISATIVVLLLVCFIIYLLNYSYKQKIEIKEKKDSYMRLYEEKEKYFNETLKKYTKINSDFTFLRKELQEETNKNKELLEKYKNLVLKKDKEKEELFKEIKELKNNIEIEKSLNEKHLETIDSLLKQKENADSTIENISNVISDIKNKSFINHTEEFYLCLLKTYKNFANIDSSIDKRTKVFREFILTKEAIEYLILQLSKEKYTDIQIMSIQKILSKQRIKDTEIGNYDLIINDSKIYFKNKLK